jgi:DNA modification methylase
MLDSHSVLARPNGVDAIQRSGDVFDFLNDFPLDSVDVFITDPPYPIQLGTRDFKAKQFQGDHYATMTHDALRQVLATMTDCLKPDGVLFLMTNEANREFFEDALKLLGYRILNRIVWIKSLGFDDGLVMGGHFLNAYETILYATRGKVERINDRMNAHYFPVKNTAPGRNTKPPSLYAHLLQPFDKTGHVIVDPFAGSDPLNRCKLNRQLSRAHTVSNVFKTTDDCDPADTGLKLRNTTTLWQF